MTVTYTAQVATSSFSCFLRLLIRWRGSIYKLLWKDFLVFALIYFTLSFVYRFVLTTEQRRIFEMVARYCEANNELIPVAFVLGFFVSLVISRWWNQLFHIPWPDRMAMFVTANVDGVDERARLMRRTMMRYLCLAYVITMASICPAVRKRFPTFQHMTDAGFMTTNEMEVLQKIDTPHNKYFIPCAWATSLVKRARKEGRIKDDFAVKTLNDEINEFRGHLGALFLYDWITVPLVYTQVVTWAVYMFFFSCLMGRQFLRDDVLDLYFPFFTFLQYFFYMGWLKVAESLVNPFGEDDDDFDVHSQIDRNLQVSYLIVDEIHNEHPELIRDQYWDTVNFVVPHTVASEPYRIKQPHLGSAMNLNLSVREREFIDPMEVISEEEVPKDIHDEGEEPDYESPGRRAVIERVASRFPGFSRLLSVSSVRSSAYGSQRNSIHRNMSDLADVKEQAYKASVTEPSRCDAKTATPSDHRDEQQRRQRERYDSTMTDDSDNVDLMHTLTSGHQVTEARDRDDEMFEISDLED